MYAKWSEVTTRAFREPIVQTHQAIHNYTQGARHFAKTWLGMILAPPEMKEGTGPWEKRADFWERQHARQTHPDDCGGDLEGVTAEPGPEGAVALHAEGWGKIPLPMPCSPFCGVASGAIR